MKMTNSRLGELIQNSSQARRFSGDWYEIRRPKNHRFGFPHVESINLEQEIETLTVPSKPVREEDLEWAGMEEEIKAAKYILAIGNDEESDDFVPYSQETLARATTFLTRQMIHAHSARVIGMGLPQIGPADHGSVDLYWEKEDRTLLINFPRDSNVANFYGSKSKSEISGRFDPSEARPELIFWLADK